MKSIFLQNIKFLSSRSQLKTSTVNKGFSFAYSKSIKSVNSYCNFNSSFYRFSSQKFSFANQATLNPFVDILNNELNKKTISSKNISEVCQLLTNIHDTQYISDPELISNSFVNLLNKLDSPLSLNELAEVLTTAEFLNINFMNLANQIISSLESSITSKVNVDENNISTIIDILFHINQNKDQELNQYILKLTSEFLKEKTNDEIISILKNNNLSYHIIIKYLNSGFIDILKPDQSLIDFYQKKLIQIDESIIEEHSFAVLRTILRSNFALVKYNLNLNMVFEHYVKLITNNLDLISSSAIVEILSSYSFYLFAKMQTTADLVVEEKHRKLFEQAEKTILSNGMEDFRLSELVEIVDYFSSTRQGSPELFLTLEKYIGINIDQLSHNHYLPLIEGFIYSTKYRKKFLQLMQKKIVENKDYFKLSELIKLSSIFSTQDDQTSHAFILTKLEPHFISKINASTLDDIISLCKCYFPHKQYKNINLELIEYLNKIDLPSEVELNLPLLTSIVNGDKEVASKTVAFQEKLLSSLLEHSPAEYDKQDIFDLFIDISNIQKYLTTEKYSKYTSSLSKFENRLLSFKDSFGNDKEILVQALNTIGYKSNSELMLKLSGN